MLPKGMLGTPRRTVVVGVAALVLATILLLAYLSHYRSSVSGATSGVAVLRAKAFIPRGTTALTLARKNLFDITVLPKEQVKDGAVTDAAVLHGQVALDDIYPGQQLTAADFGVTATSTALSGSNDLLGASKSVGTMRAMSISLDEAHGVAPQVQTGDRVDVYVQVNGSAGLLFADALVLAAPNQAAAGTSAPTSANYIVRVPTKLASRVAFAAEQGNIWFALRPQRDAKPSANNIVSADNFFQVP